MQGAHLGCLGSMLGEPGEPRAVSSVAHSAGISLDTPENQSSVWTSQSILPPGLTLGWGVPQVPLVSTSTVNQATAEVKSVVLHCQGGLADQGCTLRKGMKVWVAWCLLLAPLNADQYQ